MIQLVFSNAAQMLNLRVSLKVNFLALTSVIGLDLGLGVQSYIGLVVCWLQPWH